MNSIFILLSLFTSLSRLSVCYDKITSKYFISGHKLGSGRYSDVFIGYRISDGECVAIKKFHSSESEKEDMINEFKILASLQHENIIGVLDDFYVNEDGCYMVMEKCDYTLEDYLTGIDHLDCSKIQDMLMTILNVLDYIHMLDLSHRDLKLNNILICGKVLKIADFGLASFHPNDLLDEVSYHKKKYYGHYPPEVLKGKMHDCSVDMWGFGHIVKNIIDLNICDDDYFSEQLSDLAWRCQRYKPSKRLSAYEALYHSVFD